MNFFPLIGFLWRWAPTLEEHIANQKGVDPVVIVDEYFDAVLPLTKRYHPEWAPFLDDLKNTMHAVLGK